MKRAQTLDQTIRSIAQQEREALGELVVKLRELDQFRGYEDLGFSSLFDYLTRGVGYSAGSAQRRIDAARLIRDVPEVKDKLQSGELDLHHVASVSKALRQTKKVRQVSSQEKRDVLKQIQRKTEAQTQQLVASFFDLSVITETKRSVQKDQSVRVEITLSREVANLVEQAQGLIAHTVPTKNLASFLEYVAKKIIKQKTHLPVKKSLRTRDTKGNLGISSQSGSDFQFKKTLGADSSKTGRTRDRRKSVNPLQTVGLSDMNSKNNLVNEFDMSTATSNGKAKNQVERNFEGDVKSNVKPDKNVSLKFHRTIRNLQPLCLKCGSKWFLQTDHKMPRWSGGKSNLDNLQTLCGTCNRAKYRKESGVRPCWKTLSEAERYRNEESRP